MQFNQEIQPSDLFHVYRGQHTHEVLTKIKIISAFRADFSLISPLSSIEVILRAEAEGSISGLAARHEIEKTLSQDGVREFFESKLSENEPETILDALRNAIIEDTLSVSKVLTQGLVQFE